MTTRKQQLMTFLAQNDNGLLDEEEFPPLWVSIHDDGLIELGDTDDAIVSRFQLTLTEL